MTNWSDSANCRGQGDAMFPESRNGPGIRAAKELCDACPVHRICLSTAMAEEGGKGLPTRHGIRGGLTPSQRAYSYKQSVRQRTEVAA